MIDLKPVIIGEAGIDFVEKKIMALLRKSLYLPLVRELGVSSKVLKNNKNLLAEAIKSGRIQFFRGKFSGRFSAAVSKELAALGARWDRKTGTFQLPQSSLPPEILSAISESEAAFSAKLFKLDSVLKSIVPEKITEQLKISDHIDRSLWKVEKDIDKTMQKITVSPKLSAEAKRKLADEYELNLQRYIQNWTVEEIVNLREKIKKSVLAGERNEDREKIILKMLGESNQQAINKARFLARQETNLLMTEFKKDKYLDAGVEWYEWRTSNHPVQAKGAKYLPGEVRHDHGELAGKLFSWNDPPITDAKTGRKNHPRQDYNCRCNYIPVVNPKGILKTGFGCTYMEKSK